MSLLGDDKPEPEIVMSPVAKPNPKGTVNKDGFVKGQVVEEKDYFAHIAAIRNKK
jgi:hypothetical protein